MEYISLRRKHSGSNFELYAKAEADRQTHDCIEEILKGNVLIPPFNEKGTIYETEYVISFRKELISSEWNFKSPIVPDAIMIYGTTWLIMECKHSFSNKQLKEFDQKCDFIVEYAASKWVHKKYPVPTEVIRVACSATAFSTVAMSSISSKMIKLVRKGLAYERVK